jgi:hypothetical protein
MPKSPQPEYATLEMIDHYRLRDGEVLPEVPEGWVFDGFRALTADDIGSLFIPMSGAATFRPMDDADSWLISNTDCKRIVLRRSGVMPLSKSKVRRWTDHVDDDGAAYVSKTWSSNSSGGTFVWTKKCEHTGEKPIDIGKYKGQIHLAAQWDVKKRVVQGAHVICPLNGSLPKHLPWGSLVPIMWCELPDRGGVPPEWGAFIQSIVNFLDQGYNILAYCVGSHGRTGTFAASLISVLEPETKDPIAAIRKRHCEEAVESLAQARAIFALRGEKLPEKYEKEFKPYTPITTVSNSKVVAPAAGNSITSICSTSNKQSDTEFTQEDLDLLSAQHNWPHGFN